MTNGGVDFNRSVAQGRVERLEASCLLAEKLRSSFEKEYIGAGSMSSIVAIDSEEGSRDSPM